MSQSHCRKPPPVICLTEQIESLDLAAGQCVKSSSAFLGKSVAPDCGEGTPKELVQYIHGKRGSRAFTIFMLYMNSNSAQFVERNQHGHKFNWNTVHILAQARTKKEREFIEAWHSTEKALNKHIEIDPVYGPLQTKERRGGQREKEQTIRLKQGN
ncbi:hypothetical protein T265_10108 [Opisthorchis viverrini]|uniref:Uncharacterized protein n=1 Tax=Opisthorchis viverrini TaxID=6198 RepID=A0A074Z3K9_OPIVI|nr:hypothetical protein T265_10108 [Opisthorchis viverrini]KER21613.1 hypothetical protein T265_10108 [Opisthorchis viverrini]